MTLNRRPKQHGGAGGYEAERCPMLSYCRCRSRGVGIDITCEKINTYKLNVSVSALPH